VKSIIVITGMSGSGKTTAVRSLEDTGWFCIDNLPAPLLLKVADLAETKDNLAFVVDVREQQFLKDVPTAIEDMRRAGHRVEVLFLDSSDDVLARRYSETRRRHPLSGSGGVPEGLSKERDLLRPMRNSAEHVFDTSALTVHELRKQVSQRFGTKEHGLALTVMSFGFKYGVPSNADMVLDVRFMPNPFFVPELKAFTGKDERVAHFVLDRPDSWVFLDKTYELLEFLLPRYQKEGKSYITVAIGCTGGKHRSVAIAAALVKRLSESSVGATAQLLDRDIDKE
jgi:UPF0042 nucleotide-binding protein